MSSWINGRDALAELDTQVGRIRTSLAAALSAADGIEARRTIIQGEQAEAYRALAAIRLDVLQASSKAEFGRAGETARALAERHSAFVASERAALEAAAEAVAKQEHRRTELAAQYDAAVAAYEAKVAETEAALKQSEAYTALVEAAEEARAVTQRAHQKLLLARTDREEKGAPYEQDPLFSYLWKRKFRSSEYKAPAITRFLDGWVAKLCRYDQAFLNYQRLTELPDRIAEHAAYVAGLEEKAEAALVAAEERAMAEAGVEQLKSGADAIKAEMASCDAAIAEAEERHRETAQRHEAAQNEEAGPAVEARALLIAELRKASFPDLRILAAETVELEDDRIVDTLVRLRAEEMALELEASDRMRRPKILRDDLAVMEGLRRQFKEARYDSPYALISRAAFDDMLANLARGQTDIREALRKLSRAVRRSEPQAHPDFGGRRRQVTIGLPDIMGGMIGGVLGEILEEVFEETTRRGGGYGSGPIFPGPPKRASRPSSGSRSFPKGGGRSSGGGGRRGGGGFRTGGGF
ncbi:hypothetical protein [Hyphomonas sp.]|uniref:hypothetical protein n=1 Tax=Hyphomonas sp. TaxID=87 RepID=UPI00391DD9D6